MSKARLILLISLSILTTGYCNSASPQNNNMKTSANKETYQIFPKGDKINNHYFSGTAWLKMLATDQTNFDVIIGNVIFEPGVRNNWHSHPRGQILICTRGQGYYQEKEKPIQLLQKGDIVEILPDVIHWHGATPDSEFEHIAISTQASKGPAVWLNPVTDKEYNSYTK